MVGKGQEALLCVEDVAQMLTDAQILEAALLSIWGRDKGKPNTGLNNYK